MPSDASADLPSRGAAPASSASAPIKKLPTFRVGFNKQMDALRGYAVASKNGTVPVRYADVAKLVGVHESNVSSMNPFFVENGFLEKSGAGLLPTQPVIDYNRAHQWDAATAATKLAGLVEKAWFGEAITKKLLFRAMSEDQVIETLAAVCMAGPDAKAQLRVLVDLIEMVGLARRENGMLHANRTTQTVDAPASVETPPPSAASPLHASAAAEFAAVPIPAPGRAPAGVVQFQVSVNIDMTELSGWSADRISALFAGVAQVLAAQKGGGHNGK